MVSEFMAKKKTFPVVFVYDKKGTMTRHFFDTKATAISFRRSINKSISKGEIKEVSKAIYKGKQHYTWKRAQEIVQRR